LAGDRTRDLPIASRER